MLKLAGKCMLFCVILIINLQEIIGSKVTFNSFLNLELNLEAFTFLESSLVSILLVLAFLEVKSAVWLVSADMLFKAFTADDGIRLLLFVLLLTGLMTYYDNISELKPLNQRKNNTK